MSAPCATRLHQPSDTLSHRSRFVQVAPPWPRLGGKERNSEDPSPARAPCTDHSRSGSRLRCSSLLVVGWDKQSLAFRFISGIQFAPDVEPMDASLRYVTCVKIVTLLPTVPVVCNFA